MTNCISFKCNLLTWLHCEDKKMAFDYKKKLDSIRCFSVKIDQKRHRLIIRAVSSLANRNEMEYFPVEDFELILESQLLPLHRYNDNQEIIAFGRLQTIEYHQKDKTCEKCKQGTASFIREKELHDMVCVIDDTSLTLNSQKDADFSIVI